MSSSKNGKCVNSDVCLCNGVKNNVCLNRERQRKSYLGGKTEYQTFKKTCWLETNGF